MEEDAESVEGPEGHTEKNYEIDYLSISEFILMNLSRHYSVEDYAVYKFEDPSEAMTIVHILVAYVVVGIPIGYMEIVLGQYTNLGMFNIKNLMPIAHGMSYTFILQVAATTTLCVILMAQYFVYAVLALLQTIAGQTLPWLDCPKNYTELCFVPIVRNPCPGTAPCVTETRHLSTYIYWDNIYMKGVLPREKAEMGWIPIHRLIALIITWLVVFGTMRMSFVRSKKFIKRTFTIILAYRLFQFFWILFMENYTAYLQEMIKLNMSSFINLMAWKHAIVKVTIGMGLGDFSYIMFGILSSATRKTGSLMWFCGTASFLLMMMDHVIFSGATFNLCNRAKLPILKRFLLFRPENVQHELGVMPIMLSTLASGSMWSTLYFLHRFFVLLFHSMLNYTFLELSLYQRYPYLKVYAVYIKPLFCAFGVCICLVLDSKEAFTIRHDIQQVVFEFCDQFNVIIITVIVFYIYGLRKFCDDVHFMTGQPPAKFWLIGWIVAPIAITMALPLNFFDSTDLFYSYRVTTIAFFYTPYIVFLTITTIQKIYKKSMLTLLRPTDDWGPMNPIQKILRKSFNPRVDSKRKNKSYKCVHVCLIGEKAPPSDEEDSIVII